MPLPETYRRPMTAREIARQMNDERSVQLPRTFVSQPDQPFADQPSDRAERPATPRVSRNQALRQFGFVVEGDFRDVTTVQRGQGTTEEVPVTPSVKTRKDEQGNEQVYTVLQPSRSNLRRIAAQHGYYVR